MPVIKPVSIEKKSEHKQSSAQDYAYLRQHAIDLIQQMAGDTWTDYNLHDPGVTILEQICYAITDLAYRTDVPIEDLLTDQSEQINFKKNSFYKRDEILFSSPVTINDFRKILIDEIPEIDNVWLYPISSPYAGNSIHGVYNTVVQVNSTIAEKLLTNEDVELRIVDLIKRAFMTRRNLCEDLFQKITVLKPVIVEINADVLIKDQHQPEQILSEIYAGIEKLLSARVSYYTEEELLAKGYSVEDIYTGPKLNNGIVLDSELKERRTEIDPAEISRVIMKIHGVLQVKQISIRVNNNEVHNRPFTLNELSFPVLNINNGSGISLSTNKFKVQIRQSVFLNLLTKLNASLDRRFIASFYKANDYEVTGHYRDTKTYYSIQNNFPIVYGIGKEGLPAAARSSERISQVRQLKGYLLFFEQILANYLMLLTNIEEKFSSQLPDNGQPDSDTQPLYTVPDISPLLKAFTDSVAKDSNTDDNKISNDEYWSTFLQEKDNPYLTTLSQFSETNTDYQARKHRQLNHMLARFNELVTDYPVKLFKRLYKPEQEEGLLTNEIKWKSYILSNIANLNYGRTRGYNFLAEKSDRSIFNFEKRIRVLLCMPIHTNLLTAVFDDKRLTIESVQIPASPQSETPQKVNDILQPDVYQLFFTRKQVEQLLENKNIDISSQVSGDFRFTNRNESLFREAITINNYRISPNSFYGDKTGYIILFKYPDELNWQMISKHPDEASAVTSLKKLVNYFRQISVKSEGLHVVEHILLRPPLSDESYKFKFLTKDGDLLFELKDWVSFEKRDELIAELETIVNEQSPEAIKNYFSQHCSLQPGDRSTTLTTDFLIANVKSFFKQPNRFQRFEMLVKGEGDHVISESFYSFQITVVLPSWPARLQDDGFREFSKDLIVLNAPAHIKVNFKWLSITKMREFEALYTAFKEGLKANDVPAKQQAANKMIAFF